MANRNIFDLWLDPKDLADLLIRQGSLGIDWGRTIGASAATFTVPLGIGGQQIFPPRHPNGAPMNIQSRFAQVPPIRTSVEVMKWLFTVAAPNGCPNCQNTIEGAWTCKQDFLTETYLLECDECGWSNSVTAEMIADFVSGRVEDPRDFDTCTCGRRKRRISKLCTECAEAHKWDLCACGVKKLRSYTVCSECILIEDKLGKLVAIEHGGLPACR